MSPPSSAYIGEIFEHDGQVVRAFVRPTLAWPKDSNEPENACFCAYWVANSTEDGQAANCKKDTKVVELTVGDTKYSYKLPVLTNIAPLTCGEEVLVINRKRPLRGTVSEEDTKVPRVESAPGGPDEKGATTAEVKVGATKALSTAHTKGKARGKGKSKR